MFQTSGVRFTKRRLDLHVDVPNNRHAAAAASARTPDPPHVQMLTPRM